MGVRSQTQTADQAPRSLGKGGPSSGHCGLLPGKSQAGASTCEWTSRLNGFSCREVSWVKGAAGDCADLLQPPARSCPPGAEPERGELLASRVHARFSARAPRLRALGGSWRGGGRDSFPACFLFLFRISQRYGGWAVTETDFLNSPPSPVRLEGLAISPTSLKHARARAHAHTFLQPAPAPTFAENVFCVKGSSVQCL